MIAEFLEKNKIFRNRILNLEIHKIVNSASSHIFLNMGNDIEYINSRGKKYITKEWAIWLGNTSWRIMHANRIIIGSKDNQKLISSEITVLLKNKIIDYFFRSSVLELTIIFENGFTLVTFIDNLVSGQWVIRMPNYLKFSENTLTMDASTKDKIKAAIEVSKQVDVEKINYQNINFTNERKKFCSKITPSLNHLTLFLRKGIKIILTHYSWRLDKYDIPLVGSASNHKVKIKKLKCLTKKKLLEIKITPNKLDGELIFSCGFSLKIFASSMEEAVWDFFQNNQLINLQNTTNV